MGILDGLMGAAGTAILQRTFLLEVNTGNGVPRPLIVLDVVKEEEPEYTNEITKHPVEQGEPTTDHIQPQNPTLRLKGTISATPIDLATSIGNLVSGGLSLITSSQTRANFLNTGLQSTSAALGASLLSGSKLNASALLQGAADSLARSIFISAYQRGAIFDVVTKRIRYTNMVIASMTFPRDENTGDQLIFELFLEQIKIVSSQTVQIGTTADSVLNSATSLLGLGGQGLTPLSADASSAVASTQSATGFDSTLNTFKVGA